MRIRNDVTISKNKTSKNKPWLVRWWGKFDLDKESQPRYSKSFKTRKLAEKYAQLLKDDITDGISIEPQNITLQKLCDKFLDNVKNSVAPTSLRTYTNTAKRLNNYFGSHRNIKTINKSQAESFVFSTKLIRHKNITIASDSTRAKHLRNAKLIFNKGIDWDYLRKNPFKGILLGKIKKDKWHYITASEFKALINTIDNIKIRKNKKSNITEARDFYNKIMLKAFYTVMYGCGLRFGEAANLLWTTENIDFEKSKITVTNRKSKNSMPPFYLKDHEERSINAPKWVMDSLKQLKDISNSNNPYVFLSDDRLKIVRANWELMVSQGTESKWLNSMIILNTNRKFKLYCKKAGIITDDRLSVHCLRKSYGTNLANLGTPVHTLKELMGHSNIQTTMEYYLFSSDANKKKAVEALEKLVG
jgi:integrase